MEISGNECGENKKGFCVYFGRHKRTNSLQYVGTTIQRPSDRFRWHRHNGKDLKFEVHKYCETESEMFDLEVELIKEHNPHLNTKKTKHNMNRKLSKSDLEKRVGNGVWCQTCLRRRVTNGFKKCLWCEHERR